MYIVTSYNERKIEKFSVRLDKWHECHEWIRDIEKHYPLIKTFKIFDGFDNYKKNAWRAYIIAR